MHKIYSTKALVLGSAPSGEADKRLVLFTRDFGLVYATAQGVRVMKSKLKPHVELYSESFVSLVLGKGGWRLVGAALEVNHFRELKSKRDKLIIVHRIFALLRRFLVGEGENVTLYETVSSGLSYLKFADENTVTAVETLLVLRILHNLGYVGEDPAVAPFLGDYTWNGEIVSEASKGIKQMVLIVNKSFREGLVE